MTETATPAEVAGTPTLADVAALAGVSPATVSRVINGSARVSQHARTQVERAIDRLGYVRHRAAPHGAHGLGRPARTNESEQSYCSLGLL